MTLETAISVTYYTFKSHYSYKIKQRGIIHLHKYLNLTLFCPASGDCWGTRSIAVLCRHNKPVRHRWLKIAYVCSMKFIFTLVVKTIREICSILTIQSNNSKILLIAAIERRYPLYSGLFYFTHNCYVPGCFWSSCSFNKNQLIFIAKKSLKRLFHYLSYVKYGIYFVPHQYMLCFLIPEYLTCNNWYNFFMITRVKFRTRYTCISFKA